MTGCLAQGAHEFTVGNGVWSTAIEGTGLGWVVVQPGYHAGYIGDVYPAEALLPVALVATKPEFCEVKVGVHHTAAGGAEGDSDAENGFADPGYVGIIEGGFPFFADLDGEVILYFTIEFIHGVVFGMAVDGGGSGVDPEGGGMGNGMKGGGKDFGSIGTAIEDGLFVCGGVAAVDGLAGEVDEEVSVFEVLYPVAEGFAIPGGVGDAVVWEAGMAGEYDDVVVLAEVLAKTGADETGAAGDDDLFIFHGLLCF